MLYRVIAINDKNDDTEEFTVSAGCEEDAWDKAQDETQNHIIEITCIGDAY